MYRGFNLRAADDAFKGYLEDGSPSHEAYKQRIRSTIASLTEMSGRLLASRVTADWFPQIEASVFICHSHKDSNLAIRLAGFLRYEFDLESFVDSNVWGWSDDLLAIIDNEYCYQPETNTYSYERRNRSTSHVHMMLSVALAKMIDSCECVIFLNPPATISTQSYILGGTTESPWVYSELAMTGLIQQRSSQEHRRVTKAMDARADEALRVRYDVDIAHLTALSTDELGRWRRIEPRVRGTDALDVLYKIADA